MPDPSDSSLQGRIERLERQVAALEKRLEAATREQRDAGSPPPPPAEPEERRPSLADRVTPHLSWESEHWLNRIGIALLLFGLAFLFKYTIDQGWITPAVRIAFGGVLGSILLGLGLWLRPRRGALGQVLEGGGIAVGYVTVFAAYQLYALVAYPVAFLTMVAVTLATFALSVRQRDPVLSLIGVLGGLGTPFLLYSEAGTIPGLVGYTSLILAGAMALVWRERWRIVLVTAATGTWFVLAFATINLSMTDVPRLADRAALQGGIVLAWLAGGLLPLHRLRRPQTVPIEKITLAGLARPVPLLVLASPLVALVLTRETWSPVDVWAWRAVLVAASGTYGALYTRLREDADVRLTAAVGLTTAVLAAWMLAAFSWGIYTVALWSMAGVLILILGRRLPDRVLRQAGHVLVGLVSVLLVTRFLETGSGTPPLWHPPAWAEFGALAFGTFTLATTTGRTRLTYGIGLHVLLLVWLYRFFAPLPEGQAFVSVAWAAYAVTLLVTGVVRDTYALRATALATIVLLVPKLFVVDLAQLAALWRILLFLGLGTSFLVLSYYLPGLFGFVDAGEAAE